MVLYQEEFAGMQKKLKFQILEITSLLKYEEPYGFHTTALHPVIRILIP